MSKGKNGQDVQALVTVNARQDPDVLSGLSGSLDQDGFSQAVCVPASSPVSFAQNQLGEVRIGSVANTLNTNSNASGRNMPLVMTPNEKVGAFSGAAGAKAGSIGYSTEASPTLKAAGSSTNQTPTVHVGPSVRRLTPRECERLQGFPDDFTLVKYRGKPAKDAPRYRAIGNSMAVPVMRWIGRRLAFVDAITQERRK